MHRRGNASATSHCRTLVLRLPPPLVLRKNVKDRWLTRRRRAAAAAAPPARWSNCRTNVVLEVADGWIVNEDGGREFGHYGTRGEAERVGRMLARKRRA